MNAVIETVVEQAAGELEKASSASELKAILMKVVEKIAGIASWAKSKLTTFFILAVVSGAWLSYVNKEVFGLEIGTMSGIFAFLALPAIAIFFLRSKLSSVEDLPENIRQFEGALLETIEKMKEQNIMDELGNLKESKPKGLIGSIKELVTMGPVLAKLKSAFDEIGQPEIIANVIMVANPGFATVVGLLVAVVCFMLFLSGIGAIALLFV